MTLIECLLPLSQGQRIIFTGSKSRNRYEFTRLTRVQPVDDRDVAEFDARTITNKTCGCNGQGSAKTIKAFQIVE